MNLYTLQDNNAVIHNKEKKYTLQIRDLPEEQKPREKLIAYGPSVLQASELLAIVFGVGTKKEEVLAMSNRLLKEYGEKALTNQTDPKKIAESLEIPLNKACQIIACMELGKRFFKTNDKKQATIRTPKEAYEYLKDMGNLPKEHLRGLYLNNHYRLIHDEVISIGTLNANIIHPREVFKPALEYSASAVILAHNHPSGIAKPSQEDITITKQLREAATILGIDLLDHIIITKGKFVTIPERSYK